MIKTIRIHFDSNNNQIPDDGSRPIIVKTLPNGKFLCVDGHQRLTKEETKLAS